MPGVPQAHQRGQRHRERRRRGPQRAACAAPGRRLAGHRPGLPPGGAAHVSEGACCRAAGSASACTGCCTAAAAHPPPPAVRMQAGLHRQAWSMRTPASPPHPTPMDARLGAFALHSHTMPAPNPLAGVTLPTSPPSWWMSGPARRRAQVGRRPWRRVARHAGTAGLARRPARLWLGAKIHTAPHQSDDTCQEEMRAPRAMTSSLNVLPGSGNWYRRLRRQTRPARQRS